MTKGTLGRASRSALAAALLALPACGLLGRGGPPAPIPADTAREERIRGEVEARIAAEPSLGAARVRVEVLGRTVALHGSVPGFGALQCALANAEMVEGVGNVADFLVLESGPRTVRCLAPRTLRA